VQTCVGCGRENSPDARFCDKCGSPLAAQAASPEQLKTITVLFADVTGSTALGERLEPETLRRVMERYFELARRVIERHMARWKSSSATRSWPSSVCPC